MMSGIAVKKGETSWAAGRAHRGEVGEPEAEEIAVEADGFVPIAGVDEDVTQPHVAGLEAAHGPGGLERLRIDRSTAEDLGGDAVGVHAPHEVDDAAPVGLVAGAGRHLHPAVLELLGNLVEGG